MIGGASLTDSSDELIGGAIVGAADDVLGDVDLGDEPDADA